MTDFFDVVASQRAHRSFSDADVSDELIGRVLAAAVHAPSAENRQPWEFVVVRDAASRALLGELMERAWDRGGRRFAESRLDPRLLAEVDAGIHGGVSGAPALIVVCVDLDRGMEQTVGSSIFPAVQNLLLAAGALGLGTALTTIATSFDAELRELLRLPPQVRAVAIIPIGWPARPLGPAKRDSFALHTHRERYGDAW
jgi:nitroreductase